MRTLLLLLAVLLAACPVENAETFNQTYGSVFTRECGRACNGQMVLSEWHQSQKIDATCLCVVPDAGPLPAERP